VDLYDVTGSDLDLKPHIIGDSVCIADIVIHTNSGAVE
jgi:hypothetical protein